MPTYQYVCTACDQPLEAVQSFSDAALTECPACAGRLRKVYGAVGVVFKGSGFYKTDSRDAAKKADAPAAKTDSGASTSSSSSSDGGSGSSTSAPAAGTTSSTPASSSSTSSTSGSGAGKST